MLCGCFSFAWMGEFAHELGHTYHTDWRLVALARSSVVLILAAIALSLSRQARFVILGPGILWVRSIAGSLSLLCTFYAFNRLRTPEVLTLTNTFPIWVAFLSWPILREKPSRAVWLAAGCGIVGVALIQQGQFDGANTLAFCLALVAALSSAIAMLGLHQLRGIDIRAIVAHFSGVATVFTLTACFVGEPTPWEQVADPPIASLLLGVGATATVGQVLLTLAFLGGSPARVSVVGLTQILFALALDPLFGHSNFQPSMLAGIGLVLAPTAWVMAGRTGNA